MNTVTITKSTASALDIGSQHYDIELNVPKNHYIVAIPSFYESDPTVHNLDDAITEYNELKDLGYPVHVLDNKCSELEPTYDCDGNIDGFESII